MFSADTQVLVIDDMTTMRKIVIKALREIGLTKFLEAADGTVGWEIISAANPRISLVVSDWNMPKCTGLDLLKRVRSDSRFSSLPFVLVTAEAEKSQIVEAVQAGVSSYIVKPFSTESLKVKIESIYKKVAG